MRILPVVPDNNVRNLYFANEFTFEDLMQIRHKMDTGMDMCHSYTYVVVVTAILVFSAKDHVLLQIITWIRNLCKRGNRSRNPAIIATKESKKSSRSKQFITCKEASDIVIGQLLGWIAIYTLSLTPALKYAFASNLCHGTDEIKLILGIHAGKLLFKTFYVSFVKFNLLSFVRHAIMAAFCLWFLLSGTTGAIGLLALVYDMGDVQIQLEEIMDTWKTPFYSKARYYNTVLGVVMRVVFNCVIPTSFIIYIVINSSPIAANPSNLALLFLFLMYTFAVNTFLIITAISKMRNARQVRYLYKIARQDDKSELEFYYLSNILHRANPNSPFRCKTDNPGISTIYCNNIISSTTTTTSSPQRTDS